MTKPVLVPLLLAFFLSALAFPQMQAADPAPANEKQKTGATKMNLEELRIKLSPMQYQVACEGGTEPPFRNAFWDNKEPGLYVDVISGEPLFASIHKFDSGTGWPSFTEALKKDAVVEKKDATHGMVRVEVRSSKSDAHLGHVFNDGPGASGMRYCINSASLRFVPVAKLQEAGYGEYAALFAKTAEAKK